MTRWRLAIRGNQIRPDVAAATFLFIVYSATLARGVTYWDAGEFLAAVHSLGIPHPPGTPLFILAARVWSMISAPMVGFTIAVNAFSALCTAVAFGLVANLFWRSTRDALVAFVCAVTAGLMSTVWLNATETEVYAAALCMSMLILWTAQRGASSGEGRWVVLTLYLCGLAWTLHLTALLVAPAAAYALATGTRKLSAKAVASGLVLSLVGASVILFMLIRARHDPAINQANPDTWRALFDTVERHQYDVAPMWPRRAPIWLQFGNVFEYADWQFALGLAPTPPPTVFRTAFTLLYAVLAIYGNLRHRTLDRRGWRVWMILLATTSVGVVLYLNMRAGASYGYGVLPVSAVHEARDRDYFFTWAFVVWGVWAGLGLVCVARALAERLHVESRARRNQVAVTIALCASVLPAPLNWRAITAARGGNQRAAETQAIGRLAAAPPRAVLFAVGDNDTYPLWYLQQVRNMRTDVIVVTIPLLAPEWYRAELRRRHALLDSAYVTNWYGFDATAANVRRNAASQRRPVVSMSKQ